VRAKPSLPIALNVRRAEDALVRANPLDSEFVSQFLASITDAELACIAAADHGQDLARHLDQLRLVTTTQRGLFSPGQRWYPYEVVELTAHALTPGREREFALCTLLVIGAVVSGFDSATDLNQKFADQVTNYDLLPPELRAAILAAYKTALESKEKWA
jgi:hypothetical protein